MRLKIVLLLLILAVISSCKTRSVDKRESRNVYTVKTDSVFTAYIDTIKTVTGNYIPLEQLLAVADTTPITLTSEGGYGGVTVVRRNGTIKLAPSNQIRYKERIVYRYSTDTLRTTDTLIHKEYAEPDTLAYKVSSVLVDYRLWLLLLIAALGIYFLRKTS